MSDGCWTTTWPGIWSSSRGIERQDKVGSKGLLIFEKPTSHPLRLVVTELIVLGEHESG